MTVFDTLSWAIMLLVTLTQTSSPVTQPAEDTRTLSSVTPNRWLKLHVQSSSDSVHFVRQQHGGSCFDSRRNRLILFGSNTHGKDWMNSPVVFDLATRRWSQMYPNDPRSSYRVNEAGLPVAGPAGEHPWAMHTFGSVVYDPVRDEMVVCSYPGHMVPGRFSDSLADLWDRVKRHPTWTYRLQEGTWQPLGGTPQHFFPYCAVYDSDRDIVVGYKTGGVYQLGGSPRQWKRVCDTGYFGWHTNAVYDSRHKAVLVFGTHTDSNDIVAYLPKTGEQRIMPTPGPRPPADQHNPMCFDEAAKRTVVVVDRPASPGASPSVPQAETWLYDFASDSWTQLPEATLPFGCRMNYTMEYDPNHKVCLLVTGDNHRPTTVWALRIVLP